MFLTFSRILKYGFQNFTRNGWLGLATVAVMTLTLFVLQGLLIFNVVGETAVSVAQNKIDISVYFKSATAEDSILGLKKSLENLSEVKKVEYISADRALAEFKTHYQENSVVSQAVEELGENPLLSSLNIKAYNPKQYAAISAYLGNESLKPLIEKISYAQNQVVIERLNNIIETIQSGGVILTILATIIAILVAFSAIQMAIYTNRETIAVMRVVGASNNLIRGPYIVEGVLNGISAGILSLILMAPLIFYVSPYLFKFIPQMDLLDYFTQNLVHLLCYQLFFGIILGVFSSWVAVRRYLKV